MSDLVEFRHLKYIVALAEAGNFTRAAEQLFLSQPSLSKQIKDIEDEIGFPIFVRTREGVRVTPSGQMMVAYAQEMLAGRAEIITMALAVHRGDIPPLRLGFSSFIDPKLLQIFRDSYARMFPKCPIHLSGGITSSLLQRLEQGFLDGAILPMPIEGSQWVFQQISRDPLVVCMRTDDPLAREVALAFGQSPFDTGFTALQTVFTGTVANVASLIAIVVGGYQFAHGEPGAKKVAYLAFGLLSRQRPQGFEPRRVI